MSDTISEKLQESALAPSEYELDGETVKQRKAEDVIKLLNHAQKRKFPTRKAFAALGVAEISTPGSRE